MAMHAFPSDNFDPDPQLPDGPWIRDQQQYPDRAYCFDYRGMKCEVIRTPWHTWNGYVTVPPTHICHEDHPRHHEYTSEEFDTAIDIHGGITGGGRNSFGFDTCHYGDIVPYDVKKREGSTRPNARYWTYEDTKNEVIRLADQLEAFHNKKT